MNLWNKVKILNSRKTDWRFNFWKIIWVEMVQSGYYLSHFWEREFMRSFDRKKYKVAYIDCFTNRACVEWVMEEDLTKDLK